MRNAFTPRNGTLTLDEGSARRALEPRTAPVRPFGNPLLSDYAGASGKAGDDVNCNHFPTTTRQEQHGRLALDMTFICAQIPMRGRFPLIVLSRDG